MIKRVVSLRPELESLVLRNRKVLVKAQINIGVPRTTDVALTAGTEGICSRLRKRRRIEPLDVSGRGTAAGYSRGHELLHILHRSTAVRSRTAELIGRAIGIGRIRGAPSVEVGHRIPRMEGEGATDLPMAENRVSNGIQVIAELLSMSEWQ